MVKQNNIDDKSILSIIKIYLYQKGIYVPAGFYDKLNESAYSGYRTTSGIFMKLGGTKSREHFEFAKKNMPDLDMTYEEYLKNREYVTSQIFKESDLSQEDRDNTTYFCLKITDDGNFKIEGQYVGNDGTIYPINLSDVGIFKQGNYDDKEAVAVQAGGIRARVSICGSNCISGCSFCSFGSGADKYEKGKLTAERQEEYMNPLIQKVITQNGITQLFITGGNPSLDDMVAWTKSVEDSIETFKNSIQEIGKDPKEATIDVMLTPRSADKYISSKEEYKKYLESLQQMGVTSVSPNMELWTQESLDKYCAPSQRNIGTSKSEIGHQGYLDFIDASVETFGRFNVRSALIVGLNSKDEIKEAIDELISRGCYVTLSPFKAPECIQQNPRYANDLHEFEPSCNELIELSEYLKQAVKRYYMENGLTADEIAECEHNINNSLNAHNTHNTSNLCSGRDLDRLESQAYEQGLDKSTICNANEFTNGEITPQDLVDLTKSAPKGKISRMINTISEIFNKLFNRENKGEIGR